MPTLNLNAKNETEKIIKKYLEQNASEILAEKINNGTRIVKDGKTLINKKTLAGSMEYACNEAQKLTEKGARSACIQDSVVFGWVIHYFEEDSIEGILYNEDGTKYIPSKPVVKATSGTSPATPYTPPAPKPKPQMSLFELIEQSEKTEKSTTPPENDSENNDKTSPDEGDTALAEPKSEEPTEEELREAAAPDTEEPTLFNINQPVISPFYQKYMEIQKQYSDHIVLFKRGDFYEILGKNAEFLAKELNLTLTGRECGLPERIPMVGFPCYSADTYIASLIKKGLKIAVAETLNNQTTVKQHPEPFQEPSESEKHWIDDKTYIDDDGVMHTVEETEEENIPPHDTESFDVDALCKLDEIFGSLLELR